MTRQHITYLALLSLILYLPLAILSRLPLWSVMLLAPVAALLILRGLLVLTTRWKQTRSSLGEAESLAAENFIQNQDFDLSKAPPCPHCHSPEVAKMIYGKPALTRQIIEGLESGKIVSGGCMIHGGAPEWHCNNCNREFGHLTFEPRATGAKS
jgi:hypothetical protein